MKIRYKIFEIVEPDTVAEQIDRNSYIPRQVLEYVTIQQKKSYGSKIAAIQHIQQYINQPDLDNELKGKEITILPTIRF